MDEAGPGYKLPRYCGHEEISLAVSRLRIQRSTAAKTDWQSDGNDLRHE